MRRSCKAFSCEHEVEMAEHQRQFFLLLSNPALTYIVRLLRRLVEMIHMMLYEEESKGLDGPEKISTRWPARCHVTYHVHVAELKDCPPTNIYFSSIAILPAIQIRTLTSMHSAVRAIQKGPA
jgi:hypothetical protein